MKRTLTYLSAMLLVIWYSLSIIGFNVHTCKGSGRVFVTTFAEGTTCADIHPEHHCGHACHHDSSCCHDMRSCCGQGADSGKGRSDVPDTSFDLRDCCTDSYQVIALTGCRSYDDGHDLDCCGGGCSVPVYADASYLLDAIKYKVSNYYHSDSGGAVPRDCCVTFGIWRI